MATRRKAPQTETVTAVDAPHPPTIEGWSPARIRSAWLSAARGSLTEAALLIERLLGDDRVKAAASPLGDVLSLPVRFGEPGDPVVEALTGDDDAPGDWWRMLPEDLQGSAAVWMRVLGVALLQVRDWRADPETGRDIPVVQLWPASHMRWEPIAARWEVQRSDYSWIGIEPGDGQWVLLRGYGGDYPYRIAPWYGLAKWWLHKQQAIQDWADYDDKHASGLRLITGYTGNAQRLLETLRERPRNAVVVDSEDTADGKVVESTARSWESFRSRIELADRAPAMALLGQNLSTEVSGGSRSAAEVHERVSATVRKALSEQWSTQIREQLLTHYVDRNFNGAAAPYPEYKVDPEPGHEEWASGLGALGTLLVSAAQSGVELDLEYLSDRFGVPMTRGVMPFGGPAMMAGQTADLGVMAATRSRQSEQHAQRFVDRVGDEAAKEMRAIIGEDIDRLIEILDSSDSVQDALDKLPRYLETSDPVALADAYERMVILCDLAGKAAITEQL